MYVPEAHLVMHISQRLAMSATSMISNTYVDVKPMVFYGLNDSCVHLTGEIAEEVCLGCMSVIDQLFPVIGNVRQTTCITRRVSSLDRQLNGDSFAVLVVLSPQLDSSWNDITEGDATFIRRKTCITGAISRTERSYLEPLP